MQLVDKYTYLVLTNFFIWIDGTTSKSQITPTINLNTRNELLAKAMQETPQTYILLLLSVVKAQQ